jgi:hypothetical protein
VSVKLGTVYHLQFVLWWYDVITLHNYFSSNGEILIQKEGLVMGAPTSGLLTEFFLQHLEHLHISHLSDKYKIIKYFRYVDDVLVIYDTNHTDIQNMSRDFSTLHLRLKFTAGCETDNQINFLDVTIHRTPTNWRIAMYRKPTFTDTDIPYTCNLQEDEYNTEVTTIQNIPYNNAFAIHHENPPTLQPPP